MDISVAVVTYNAAGCLRHCLESLMCQTPHGGSLEILVVDGCSTDGTQDIVRSFGDRVRLVENPGRTISSNRNVALREARYSHIAFTDADCIVASDWLKRLSSAFDKLRERHESLAGVGGGNVAPAGGNGFQQALGIALDSYLGSLGSVQGRRYESPVPVPSLACLNVLYDRDILLGCGGFNEAFENMCEDADLNFRLKKAGYLLYYVPSTEVEHAARPSLRTWCRNMFDYGKGRAKMMLTHRTVFSISYLMALAFVPAWFIAAAGLFLSPYFALILAYIPIIVAAALLMARREGKPQFFPHIALIFASTHFMYASGLLVGLLKGKAAGPTH